MSDTKPHIPGSSGNTKQDKCQNKTKTKTKQKATHRYHIQTSENQRKRKNLKEEKEYLSYREAKIKITFNLSQDTKKAKIK